MPGGVLRILLLSISEAMGASAHKQGSLCTLNLCFPGSLQKLSLQAGFFLSFLGKDQAVLKSLYSLV